MNRPLHETDPALLPAATLARALQLQIAVARAELEDAGKVSAGSWQLVDLLTDGMIEQLTDDRPRRRR